MSDLEPNKNQPVGFSLEDDAARINAIIAYALMVIGFFTGIFWIIGAIWAMVKKEDAKGTLFEDHYTNIVKTFWWSLAFSILGFFLSVLVIGYVILLIVWIWSMYKVIKGLARITSNKPYN